MPSTDNKLHRERVLARRLVARLNAAPIGAAAKFVRDLRAELALLFPDKEPGSVRTKPAP